MDNKEADSKSQSNSAPTAFLVDLVSNRKIPITTPRCRVGRDDLNDIVITGDQSISRFHFIINKEENQYSVQDAKSRHGTFLNGNQISGPEPINDGDVLKIGVSLFWFVIEAPAQAEGDGAAKPDGEKAKIVLNPNEADLPGTGATQDINQLEIIDKLTSLTEEAEAKSDDKEETKKEESKKEESSGKDKKDKKEKKAAEEEAAKEKAEKEKAEKEKAEKEKAEKEQAEKEAEELAAKEKAEKEKAEKEAEEAAAKEKAEAEEAAAKEKAEKEAEEAAAKEKAEKEEAEAREKAEKEAEEAAAREKAEAEEAAAKEKAEKEAEEAAAKEKEESNNEDSQKEEVSVNDLMGPLQDDNSDSKDEEDESNEKLSQNDTLERFADIIESSDSGKSAEESKSSDSDDSRDEEREEPEIAASDNSNISSSTRNGAEEMTIQGPSTVPDWCKRYFADELKGLNKELDELNEQIRKPQDKIKDVESQASLTKGIRNTLLVSEGDDLIEACKKVLGLIGWKVTQSEEDKNELMLEGDGDKVTIVRIIWTNTNAERSHLGQLSISQTRYWCEKGTEPKGVLIVSKPGDKAPTSLAEESDEDFTDFASKKNVCLMSTLQLLSLYRESAHKNTKGDDLRNAVYDSKGWLKGYKLEPGDSAEEGSGKSLSSLLSS